MRLNAPLLSPGLIIADKRGGWEQPGSAAGNSSHQIHVGFSSFLHLYLLIIY